MGRSRFNPPPTTPKPDFVPPPQRRGYPMNVLTITFSDSVTDHDACIRNTPVVIRKWRRDTQKTSDTVDVQWLTNTKAIVWHQGQRWIIEFPAPNPMFE